jgi:hypothetical protein
MKHEKWPLFHSESQSRLELRKKRYLGVTSITNLNPAENDLHIHLPPSLKAGEQVRCGSEPCQDCQCQAQGESRSASPVRISSFDLQDPITAAKVIVLGFLEFAHVSTSDDDKYF